MKNKITVQELMEYEFNYLLEQALIKFAPKSDDAEIHEVKLIIKE